MLWKRSFEAIHLSYFSLTFCSLILAPISRSCKQQFLLWRSNGIFYFLHSSYIFYFGFFFKEYLSIFPLVHLLNHLFISSGNELLYYYLFYNPIFSLFCPNVGHWKPICLFWDTSIFFLALLSFLTLRDAPGSFCIAWTLELPFSPWSHGFYFQRMAFKNWDLECLLLLACHYF